MTTAQVSLARAIRPSTGSRRSHGLTMTCVQPVGMHEATIACRWRTTGATRVIEVEEGGDLPSLLLGASRSAKKVGRRRRPLSPLGLSLFVRVSLSATIAGAGRHNLRESGSGSRAAHVQRSGKSGGEGPNNPLSR